MSDNEQDKKNKIIESRDDLDAAIISAVDVERTLYEKAVRDIRSEFMNNAGISSSLFREKVREEYDTRFAALRESLSKIKYDPRLSKATHQTMISDIFEGHPADDRTVCSLLENLSHLDIEESLVFEDEDSLVEKIQKTISVINDGIVIADDIGQLIDAEISSKISAARTEELAWYKAYQIILMKMKPEQQQEEIAHFQNIDKYDWESAICDRMNVWQKDHGYQKSLPLNKTASRGLSDVETILPDGSYLTIAANKLVDNMMEGTQTIRHPMELALNIYYERRNKKTPTGWGTSDTLDAFCQTIIPGDYPVLNGPALAESEWLNDFAQDEESVAELLEIFNGIHIHTFQTYTRPKYKQEHLDRMVVFGQ